MSGTCVPVAEGLVTAVHELACEHACLGRTSTIATTPGSDLLPQRDHRNPADL